MNYSKLLNESSSDSDYLQTDMIQVRGIQGNGALYLDNENMLASRVLQDGQLLIGRSGGAPVNSSITGGNGLIVTNGHGTITIGQDPEADLTVHDITATGAILGSNLSGTNTGDVVLSIVGNTPSTAGATLDGQTLTLQPADAKNPGIITTSAQIMGAGNKTFEALTPQDYVQCDSVLLASGLLRVQGYFIDTPRTVTIPNIGANSFFVLTAGNQTINGTKTFNGNISAANLSGTNTGDVSFTAVGSVPSTTGASMMGQSITLQPASSIRPGVVSQYPQSFGGAKTFTDTISATNLSGTNTGDVTVGAVGAVPNANGVSLTGQALTLQPADGSNPGVVTTAAQTFAGLKTFTAAITAPNISGTNTGNVTLTAVGNTPNANGASLSGQALTLQPASGTLPGLLTAGTQTIGGAKTFSSAISAPNFSGTNTGDITLTAVGSAPNANGASLSGQALTLQPASTTQPGILIVGAQSLPGNKAFTGQIGADDGLRCRFVTMLPPTGGTASRSIYLPDMDGTFVVKNNWTNARLSYRKVGASQTVSSAHNIVTFTQVVGDPDVTFSGSRWTINRAGLYSFDGSIDWANNTVGKRFCYWKINSGTQYYGQTLSTALDFLLQSCQVCVYLNVNDYIEFFAWQNTGTTTQILGSTADPDWYSSVYVSRICY